MTDLQLAICQTDILLKSITFHTLISHIYALSPRPTPFYTSLSGPLPLPRVWFSCDSGRVEHDRDAWASHFKLCFNWTEARRGGFNWFHIKDNPLPQVPTLFDVSSEEPGQNIKSTTSALNSTLSSVTTIIFICTSSDRDDEWSLLDPWPPS